jgi:hypothetical protein
MRGLSMSKAVKATLDRAEAQTLRSTADGIDASSPADPLAARFMRDDAAVLETAAADALMLDTPPQVGAGGELVPAADQIKHGGGNFIDMVERPDAVTAKASMDRLKLADEVHCVPLAVDTAETIQAKNSIEKMIAHQLAAAHKLAMTFAGQARKHTQRVGEGIYSSDLLHVEHATKMANASARMMDAFQKGVLVLHKLRTGGTQTVTVQHVNVSDGGQAVVTGGIGGGGGDEN